MKRTQASWFILVFFTAWTAACGPVVGPQEAPSEQTSTDGPGSADATPELTSQEQRSAEQAPAETSPEPPSQDDATPDAAAAPDVTSDAEPSDHSTPDASEPSVTEPTQPDAGEAMAELPSEQLTETAPEPTPEPLQDAGQPDQPGRPLNRPVLVGVGNFGLRLVTYDNTTWKKFGGTGSGNPHTPDLLRAVAYGDGVFVAVGGHKNMHVQRSVDGGRSWQDVGSPTGGWIGGVTYHKGVWFYATGGGPKIYRSVDRGQTWKAVALGPSKLPKLGAIRGMSSYNGALAAHGDKGTLIVSYDDGVTWKDHSIANVHDRIEHLKWIGGTWFAAGSAPYNGGYATACRTSSDLKRWQKCPFNYTRSSVLRLTGGRLYHLAGKSYQSTQDGKTWSSGSTLMTNVFKPGREWWGLRFDGSFVGPALDKLKQVSKTRRGARAWATGFTY